MIHPADVTDYLVYPRFAFSESPNEHAELIQKEIREELRDEILRRDVFEFSAFSPELKQVEVITDEIENNRSETRLIEESESRFDIQA